MGAGMGAGIGSGMAIGMSAGRQRAFEEISAYIQDNGLTVHDRDGNDVDPDAFLTEMRDRCGSFANAGRQKTALIAALFLCVLVAVATLYIALQ